MPGEPIGMRNGQACRVRLLGEEALERSGRNVSFNGIAGDLRRVAGREIIRNSEPPFHRIEILGVQNFRVNPAF
jgi:hypothetical protein